MKDENILDTQASSSRLRVSFHSENTENPNNSSDSTILSDEDINSANESESIPTVTKDLVVQLNKLSFNLQIVDSYQNIWLVFKFLFPSMLWIMIGLGALDTPTNDYIFKYFADLNNLTVSFENTSYCDINKTSPDFIKLQEVNRMSSNLNSQFTLFSLRQFEDHI